MQPCHGIEFCASSDMGSDVKSCILQIRFKRRWYGTSVGICISRIEKIGCHDVYLQILFKRGWYLNGRFVSRILLGVTVEEA